jgi:hypothetical protein
MATTQVPKVSKLEQLFLKYEFLVHSYSNKAFNIDVLGLERDDVTQELRVKLYTSILSYLKRWKSYRETGKGKPVPMYYYLRTCLSSYINDLIKKVIKAQEVFVRPGTGTTYADYGSHNPNSVQIDLGRAKVAVINGVDLFQGLRGDAKAIWALHLKGYDERNILKIVQTRFEANNIDPNWVEMIITSQRRRLSKKAAILNLETVEEFQVKEMIED